MSHRISNEQAANHKIFPQDFPNLIRWSAGSLRRQMLRMSSGPSPSRGLMSGKELEMAIIDHMPLSASFMPPHGLCCVDTRFLRPTHKHTLNYVTAFLSCDFMGYYVGGRESLARNISFSAKGRCEKTVRGTNSCWGKEFPMYNMFLSSQVQDRKEACRSLSFSSTMLSKCRRFFE